MTSGLEKRDCTTVATTAGPMVALGMDHVMPCLLSHQQRLRQKHRGEIRHTEASFAREGVIGSAQSDCKIQTASREPHEVRTVI